MTKKDISDNLYQKCLILCSNILLKVLHNTNVTVLLPWQHTGFQTSSILKAFLATFCVPFSYFQMVPCTVCMIQQVYRNGSLSLWPHLAFFELKIINMLKSSGWGLEKSELRLEQNFYSHRCVSCRTISLPSFNGLCCKLAKIALFTCMYLR